MRLDRLKSSVPHPFAFFLAKGWDTKPQPTPFIASTSEENLNDNKQ
jgi:hypothetical protein